MAKLIQILAELSILVIVTLTPPILLFIFWKPKNRMLRLLVPFLSQGLAAFSCAFFGMLLSPEQRKIPWQNRLLISLLAGIGYCLLIAVSVVIRKFASSLTDRFLPDD